MTTNSSKKLEASGFFFDEDGVFSFPPYSKASLAQNRSLCIILEILAHYIKNFFNYHKGAGYFFDETFLAHDLN